MEQLRVTMDGLAAGSADLRSMLERLTEGLLDNAKAANRVGQIGARYHPRHEAPVSLQSRARSPNAAHRPQIGDACVEMLNERRGSTVECENGRKSPPPRSRQGLFDRRVSNAVEPERVA